MKAAPFFAAALLALAAPPAAALEAPKDYAGPWTLSGVSEGDPVCKVKLGREMAIGGWDVELAKDCYGKFGLSEDIAAWTLYPDGAIGFIDPLRKLVIRFEPVEIGGYVGDGPQGRPISLDREQKGRPPTVQQQLSGRWAVTRLGGQIVCRYAMTSNRAGTAGTLKALPGCAAGWTGVTHWQRAKGRIQLLDAKGRVRLALPGDPIQGFDGDGPKGELYGFVRDW